MRLNNNNSKMGKSPADQQQLVVEKNRTNAGLVWTPGKIQKTGKGDNGAQKNSPNKDRYY